MIISTSKNNRKIKTKYTFFLKNDIFEYFIDISTLYNEVTVPSNDTNYNHRLSIFSPPRYLKEKVFHSRHSFPEFTRGMKR